jgi:hypothetical protein
MQKVVGSSPIIRSSKAPLRRGFVASCSSASNVGTVNGSLVPIRAHSIARSYARKCALPREHDVPERVDRRGAKRKRESGCAQEAKSGECSISSPAA